MSHSSHSPSYVSTPVTISSLSSNCFLSDVSVYHVDESGQLLGAIGSPIEQVARDAVERGTAMVSTDEHSVFSGSSSAVAIPIHRGGRVVSVAVLSSKGCDQDNDDLVGVFEVWEPTGPYAELTLRSGFYGKMERFHNVSSFVRFEKGTGLPGQVWKRLGGVVHDDLSNHPGFLRAAGASADLLVTAVGIPIASSEFHSVAVLISSAVSPLARGFEVWNVEGGSFHLLDAAYRDFGDGIALPLGSKLPKCEGLPSLAASAGGAILCDDVNWIFAGRQHDAQRPDSASALAIPFFDGEIMTSVVTLLF